MALLCQMVGVIVSLIVVPLFVVHYRFSYHFILYISPHVHHLKEKTHDSLTIADKQ